VESEPYHPRMLLSDRGRRILFLSLGAVGYLLLARVLLVEGIADAGGIGGIDAVAYWTAAGHALRGESLYEHASFAFAAYQYPPPFAQLLAPASLLPLPAFVWLWRAIELVGLRVATGGWTRAGIAMLIFPPVIAELDSGNVHLVMAAVTAMAMRGVAGPVGPAMLTKLSTWPLIFVAWKRDRSWLLRGAAVAAAVVAVSIAAAPGAWKDYIAFLSAGSLPTGGYTLLAWAPLALRLVAAAALGLAAVRWIRLAPIAVTLAYPVVWVAALSTLTAVVTPLARASQVQAPRQEATE